MRTSALILAALAVAAFSGTAHAQSFRCNSTLASVGDSKASVYSKCGEPMMKDSHCRPVPQPVYAPGATINDRPVAAVAACENVDEWTYNPGYGQFMTTLVFERGMLTAIKYGDRVR